MDIFGNLPINYISPLSASRARIDEELGFSGTDSQTNFVFVKHETIPGEMIQKKLKEKGILVRWFDHERIREYNRISIGTREDMELLIKALKEICDENG